MKTKMKMPNHILSLAMLAFIACGPKATPSSSVGKSPNTHKEDLSVHRPSFEKRIPLAKHTDDEVTEHRDYPAPTHDISTKLDVILDTLAHNYKRNDYINGYTIQVYIGSSSEEADKIKERVEALLPGEYAYVQYRQPNYRVQIGSYVEKLELEKVLALVKAEFPKAISVPHRIRISDF